MSQPVDGRRWRAKKLRNLEMVLVPVFVRFGRDEEPFASSAGKMLGRPVAQQFAHRLFLNLSLVSDALMMTGWLCFPSDRDKKISARNPFFQFFSYRR